jgi:hypothetical protein
MRHLIQNSENGINYERKNMSISEIAAVAKQAAIKLATVKAGVKNAALTAIANSDATKSRRLTK